MGTGDVAAKEKAQLVLVRKTPSQNYWQLKSLNTQNTLYPMFSAGTGHN